MPVSRSLKHFARVNISKLFEQERNMRKDGKRVGCDEPMYNVVPYIMTKRYDAMNMTTVDIPVEPMDRYIIESRKKGNPISHMGLVVAAYMKTVEDFPMLNRFVVNKKIYQRNEFNVAMVVIKASDMDNGTMSKMFFDYSDDVATVQKKIDEYIAANRKDDNSNSTDKLIKVLLSVPGLCNFLVGLFKFMDKHGLLPKSIIDASPFHNSMCITNLASIRTNHIYHHCYEFGTTSVFLAMGNLREVPKRGADGEIKFVRCIPIGVVMDERICSGAYFAKAFRKFRGYLANPASIDKQPEKAAVTEKTEQT